MSWNAVISLHLQLWKIVGMRIKGISETFVFTKLRLKKNIHLAVEHLYPTVRNRKDSKYALCYNSFWDKKKAEVP